MTVRDQFREYGPWLTGFIVYQVLALLLSVALALLLVVVSIFALMSGENAEFVLDSLVEILLLVGHIAVIFHGLRLIYYKHTSTRVFWIGYLTFSILLYGFFALVDDWGCVASVPMVFSLLWLAYWVESKHLQRLFPG